MTWLKELFDDWSGPVGRQRDAAGNWAPPPEDALVTSEQLAAGYEAPQPEPNVDELLAALGMPTTSPDSLEMLARRASPPQMAGAEIGMGRVDDVSQLGAGGPSAPMPVAGRRGRRGGKPTVPSQLEGPEADKLRMMLGI